MKMLSMKIAGRNRSPELRTDLHDEGIVSARRFNSKSAHHVAFVRGAVGGARSCALRAKFMPSPNERIRDPVHNLIEFAKDGFEEHCWNVVQTGPFQRLRRIKQLGFSELVYPGATHSRMAHSLGVFHTARQLTGVVHNILGQANFDRVQANAAIAAALVHDIGHGPFSHAFEHALDASDD